VHRQALIEHRNIPDLRLDPADPRLEWEQAADRVRAAIRSSQLASGDTLPSVPDLATLQGLKPGTVRHMFLALAGEGGCAHPPRTDDNVRKDTKTHQDRRLANLSIPDIANELYVSSNRQDPHPLPPGQARHAPTRRGCHPCPRPRLARARWTALTQSRAQCPRRAAARR
jgi:DNA-binding transcriptional regulator YhcF (GntR family)